MAAALKINVTNLFIINYLRLNFSFYHSCPDHELRNAGSVKQPFRFVLANLSGPIGADEAIGIPGIIPGIVQRLDEQIHILRVSGDFPDSLIASEKDNVEPGNTVGVRNTFVSIVEEIFRRALAETQCIVKIFLIAGSIVKIGCSLDECTGVVCVRVELRCSLSRGEPGVYDNIVFGVAQIFLYPPVEAYRRIQIILVSGGGMELGGQNESLSVGAGRLLVLLALNPRNSALETVVPSADDE